MSVSALVALYEEVAAIAGELEPTTRQNDAARQVAGIYSELLGRGASAIEALVPLLDSPSEGVRLWSGAHLLLHRPHRRTDAVPTRRRQRSQRRQRRVDTKDLAPGRAEISPHRGLTRLRDPAVTFAHTERPRS